MNELELDSDLRIGNLLQVKASGLYGKVEIIDATGPEKLVGVKVANSLKICTMQQVEPIELSHHWFGVFKFEPMKGTGYDWVKDGFELYAGHHEFWWGWKWKHLEDKDRGLNVEVKYVHQLQNTWYWVKGEELTSE
jgi:hypothetical protein